MAEKEFIDKLKARFYIKSNDFVSEFKNDRYADISHYQQKFLKLWEKTINELKTEENIDFDDKMKCETLEIFKEQSNRIFMNKK